MGTIMKNAAKILPSELTTYDLLKTFAIITMIIDHVGYYFFPDVMEFRVIGRTSAPVWFFLIGYATTRELENRLIVGAAMLAAAHYMMLGIVIPVNILFTFLLIRLTLNWITARTNRSFEILFGFYWLFLLLALPSGLFIEYGTLGFLMALFGYVVRHKDELPYRRHEPKIYAAIALLGYWAVQVYWFNMQTFDALVLLGFFGMVGCILYNFKAAVLSDLTAKVGPLKHLLFITGRRSLEIYVIHIILFEAFVVYYLAPNQ